ncbi:hypothetical protein SAMN05421493_101680 [Pseudobutyrivibrio sp. 49]|uniref:hypothetical protein n=1 Tax=Pseudobutyrivibrio sp. 49 TaxID=1855344 RepID=UPI00088E4DE7|nr:hypothetical protein [Pseudobutyrivibrio sp. 49]SDH49547.1 hypothetical protein SAMN05421493_101680 [Pseudobutyrivibrio sp. 49]
MKKTLVTLLLACMLVGCGNKQSDEIIGKIPFYHLRNDILIKVIIGTIAICWLLVFACMFFDIDPLGFLFR